MSFNDSDPKKVAKERAEIDVWVKKLHKKMGTCGDCYHFAGSVCLLDGRTIYKGADAVGCASKEKVKKIKYV